MHDMNQIARTQVYISLLPINTSIHFSSRTKHTARSSTHHQHPERSRHHVTCTNRRLMFQNTPDIHHNFLPLLCAFFRYVQQYHNAKGSHVDLFWTRNDDTQGQPPRNGERKCYGKNANISSKLTPVGGWGPYTGMHHGSNLWTYSDIKCLWSYD
jgi:hypothetical protein